MKALWRISVQFFASVLILFYVLTAALPVAVFAQTVGSGTLTASPASGAAPLAVTFTATWLDASKTYNITYGDGNVSAALAPQCALNNTTNQSAGCVVQVTHTYTKAGSFTATVAGYSAQVTVAGGSTSGKPTCSITVSQSSITIGGSVTVTWTSTNATAGAITNLGNVGPSGSINLLPSSAAITTYFGAFSGPGGTVNCQASVAVSSGSTGGTIDPTQTNTPTALGVPAATPTASAGLVPCGYGTFNAKNANGTQSGNDSTSSTGCQACNLAQLIQNIMTFAIGIAIPIAAALFAYAGVLYFTSAAKPGNIEKAKEIFKDAFVGFLIAITAWLVINTFLHVIFNQGQFSGGNWFTIACSDPSARPVSNSITQVLSQLPIIAGNIGAITPDGSSGGGVSANGSPGSGGTGSGANTTGINSDSYYNTLNTLSAICDANNDTASCNAVNEFADTGTISTAVQNVLSDTCGDNSESASCGILAAMSTPAKGGSNALCNNDNCSPTALSSAGFNGSSAKVMSCIAVTENGGTATGCNGNACGTFQIMLTVNKLSGPDCGGTLNCPALCKGNNGVAVTTASCQPCVAAANNAQCNAESAAALYNQSGYAPWTTQSDNTQSGSCVNTYGN